MSKYADVATRAVKKARSGVDPIVAWKASAAEVFPKASSARSKNCPRCAFLGLAEEGLLVGIPAGAYTRSADNKRYAIDGVKLLIANPALSSDPNAMWLRIMRGERKQHNEQMDVVAALWNGGHLKSVA